MSENKLPPKERTKIPRQHMPEQPAEERRRNFTEVNLGLTVLGATTEAMRCLECAKPDCVHGLPGQRQHPRVRPASSRPGTT